MVSQSHGWFELNIDYLSLHFNIFNIYNITWDWITQPSVYSSPSLHLNRIEKKMSTRIASSYTMGKEIVDDDWDAPATSLWDTKKGTTGSGRGRPVNSDSNGNLPGQMNRMTVSEETEWKVPLGDSLAGGWDAVTGNNSQSVSNGWDGDTSGNRNTRAATGNYSQSTNNGWDDNTSAVQSTKQRVGLTCYNVS